MTSGAARRRRQRERARGLAHATVWRPVQREAQQDGDQTPHAQAPQDGQLPQAQLQQPQAQQADAVWPEPKAPFVGKGSVYIVMGAPAAGKGTQCRLLARKFGFVHISTGDIFRDLCKQGTELGLQFKEYMDRGCFVPDDVVVNFMRARLQQPDVQERGCLLDGFPRTADQAQALLSEVKVSGAFLLRVPDKTLIARAEGRRVDPVTQEIYHLTHVPPPPEVVDRLELRDRDDKLAFRQRIVVFKDQVRRVLPHLSGQAQQIDGTLTPDEVFQTFARHFEEKPAESESAISAMSSSLQQEQFCAICFTEPANFLVTPCGHQCGCEACLKAVQQHSGCCPICRVPVQGIQRVFRCGQGDGGMQPNGIPAMMGLTPTAHIDLQDKLDSQAAVKDDDEWSDDGEAEDTSEQDPVSLVVAPCRDVSDDGEVVNVMISAQLPDGTTRLPVDICAVVDVSGSMGAMAIYETEDGQTKDDGLTVLDIVKHAVKTVFKALNEGDRFSLVAFSSQAHTVLSLTKMTENGQAKAMEALEGLHPGGQTNIWAGLLAAMDALRTDDDDGAGRRQAILLLTDGQPNLVPPRGHLPELRDYKDSHPAFSFQLNTFGFGYNLNSELLLDLAKEGQGTYAFIPDAIIVGTTFVNSVANVLSTMSLSSILNIMPRAGAELAGPVLGGFEEFNESWGRGVHLGPLQQGQSRELVVPVRIPPRSSSGPTKPYLEVVLTYPKPRSNDGRASAEARTRTSCIDAVVAECRALAVSTSHEAIDLAIKNRGNEAALAVTEMQAKATGALDTSAMAGVPDSRLAALLADMSGRMSKALQGKDRFDRWGKHYLRALVRSHQIQVCTNFMDPGLQPYGGSLFHQLRERGDEIFLALPPPKPSCRPRAARTMPAAPTMNTYYAGAGGG